VLPGTGGTQRLARLLGRSRAIELMASGRLLSYEEALEMGLVNRLIEAPDEASFMQAALDYARGFTTPGSAAMSVGHIKLAVQAGADLDLEAGLALERELQAKLFASDDAAEGIAAFLEKRKAYFQGH
jgi:enoyl-CoA hydratase/carnithine racemase